MTRTLIWLTRVSTDHQDTARQRLARDRVLSSGWEMVGEVELVGVSGASLQDRPEWLRLAAQLLEKRCSLGVDAVSRLCRPSDFEFGALRFLSEQGIEIVTPEGVLDPSSGGDFLTLGLQSLISGHELRQITRRSRGGRDAAFARGEWPIGGHLLPTGTHYDRETKLWSYTEPFATLFPRTIDAVLGGEISTYADVARRHGLGSSPAGRYLVTNAIYTGILIHDKHAAGPKYPSGIRRPVPMERPTRVDLVEIGKLDAPLIDQATWAELQRWVADKTKRGRRVHQSKRPGPHRYRGSLFCAGCGEPLWAKTGSRSRTSYWYACKRTMKKIEACSPRFRGVEVDELVDRFFVEGPMSSPEGVQKVIESILEAEREDGPDPSRIRAKLGALETQEERLVEKVETGVVPDHVARRRFKALAEERQGLEEAARTMADRQSRRASLEDFASAAGIFMRWDTLRSEDRGALLSRYFPKIYLDEKGISGVQSPLLSSSGGGAISEVSRTR